MNSFHEEYSFNYFWGGDQANHCDFFFTYIAKVNILLICCQTEVSRRVSYIKSQAFSMNLGIFPEFFLLVFSPFVFTLLLFTTAFIKLRIIKSSNNAYAVRKESWSSPSLSEENLPWGQKQSKSICHLKFYRIYSYGTYSVFLRNKPLLTRVLVSLQRDGENYSNSRQGSLDNHFHQSNGKIIILYTSLYLCVDTHSNYKRVW